MFEAAKKSKTNLYKTVKIKASKIQALHSIQHLVQVTNTSCIYPRCWCDV